MQQAASVRSTAENPSHIYSRDGVYTLTQTVTYSSKEGLEAVLKSPMESGVSTGYDRLEAFLASRAA